MADWSKQLYWEDVSEGDVVPAVDCNLTMHRLVVEAGANRDFAPIHHNTQATQMQGVEEMYANNVLIQGMWERTVREYIGVAGDIKRVGPFRMNIFNTVGETMVTSGVVKRKYQEGGENLLELEIKTEHSKGTSVGPAPVVVRLPTK